jgi:hypothetical protein
MTTVVLDKMINFDTSELGFMDMEIPVHTQETITSYLIRGWKPGGFVTAMLAGDLFRAVSSADIANRQVMWAIGKFIATRLPAGSWGDYDSVHNWSTDKNNIRSEYVTDLEKNYIWQTLKGDRT